MARVVDEVMVGFVCRQLVFVTDRVVHGFSEGVAISPTRLAMFHLWSHGENGSENGVVELGILL